jgi:hypothetical protein
VAISDDATVAYWNPAALVWVDNNVSVQLYDPDDLQKHIAVKSGNVGLYLTKTWRRYYGQFAYAYVLNDSSSLGIALGGSAPNNCFDNNCYSMTSVSYLGNYKNLRYGFLLQDFYNFRPGIAYLGKYTTISAEVYSLFDPGFRSLRSGIEIFVLPWVCVRFGQETHQSGYKDFMCGLGISTNRFSVDWAKWDNSELVAIVLKF